jgi:hypothetical protein
LKIYKWILIKKLLKWEKIIKIYIKVHNWYENIIVL